MSYPGMPCRSEHASPSSCRTSPCRCMAEGSSRRKVQLERTWRYSPRWFELWLVKLRILRPQTLAWLVTLLETSRNIKHVQIFKNCQRVDLVDPKLSEVGQIPHILWNPLRSFESVQVASSPVEARNGTRCSSPSPKRRRNQADSPDSRAPRCHTEMSKTSHHSFVAQICCPSTMPPTWDQRSFDMILICFDIIR